ncbi:hypothetical protein, partial [Streptomyces sp. NPDC005970]|uniref:hypothetical protein n=1 Tax=Streptomyces sp. NPDC005970 TaxID=3156723 RepID=UPI0033DB6ACA
MSTRETLLGAAALKSLRKARGWSLTDAARALIATARRLGQPLDSSVASVQRSVARWESATRPILPSDRYQLLLAHLYTRGVDGHIALGPGSDFAELLDALAHLGEAEARLSDLRALLTRTATDDGTGVLALLGPTTRLSMAAALTDPARVDEVLIDGLRKAVGDVNAQVGSLPFARLQILLAPVIESCRRLLTGDVPAPFLPGLRAVAAQAYTLGGRLAFETRDDQASRALYAAATATADGGGDPAPTSFGRDHLRGFEGLCELYVGDAAVAHDFFADSAAALGAPRERVQRAIVSTDQALACIRL